VIAIPKEEQKVKTSKIRTAKFSIPQKKRLENSVKTPVGVYNQKPHFS
jgi:hypothetical protein